MARRITLFLLALLLAPGVAHVAAQATQPDPAKVELSREALQRLETEYEATAASSAYSSALRDQARRNAEMVRSRLKQGDFQVGDQVALVVEGEKELTGTFVVQDGPALVLPVIGSIPLTGVLRSELESHLSTQIGRFIRNPVVHARSSIRMMVTGGVGKEGYYVVPTATVFPEVLMLAGGPVKGALLDEIRVERGNQEIWGGEALQRAITEGRTVDQLGLQAGDKIVVPVPTPSRALTTLRTVVTVLSPIVLLTTLFIRLRR
jgi:protein involved in polysaccharide export with SLBB domain